VFRKHDAQKRFYTELRKRFGLAAQPAIRVIGKVADAYAALRANPAAGNYGPPGSDRRRRIEESPIVFRSSAAQPFDARRLSWQFPDDMGRAATISIWTVTGRLKSLRIMGNPKQLNLLLVNIATTSTGQKASGGHSNSYRKRQAQLRQQLQAKKTSSATAAAEKAPSAKRPASRPTSTTRSPNASLPRRNAPGAASPSKNCRGSVTGYGFVSRNGPRCIPGHLPNSARF
jgi:hypothetical protein